ncbi:Stage II sporulation protein E (SpoIIE) [Modestobacter sp. DSM 44400]|nr:Stage II sporulation protein E (SpoIIE) [Modestobacter sp. DSM 44400]
MLLPAGLPDVPDWAMAALYEPAGEAVLVGGDFYDWFTLPNGHILFFVGDVSGKGPLAGALAMSIRKALKGITWITQDPAAALPILEHALADEFQGSFATLCLVELIPGEGRVRVVLAGHPAPWLRHDGQFVEVAAPPNSVLGPRIHDRWESVELQLEASDMLMLFTDGLTEARLASGQQFGDGPFQEYLPQLLPPLSSYETVLQTYEHVRQVAALTDDVIISVLTFQPRSAVDPDVAVGSDSPA